MVQAKEICRVVFVFQGDEAIVIAAGSLARDGISIVGDIIALSACDQIRP
jgi:hypothetical protein